MRSIEITGKTWEEAFQKGLSELNVSESDVRMDIIEEGSKGLFGLFGSRPAKVRLTVREEAETDPLSLEELGLTEEKKPEPKPARPSAPKAEKPAPKPKAPVKKAEPAAEDAGEEAQAEKAAMPAPVRREAPKPKAGENEDGETAEENRPKRKPRKRGGRKKHPAGETAVQQDQNGEEERRPLPPKEPVKPLEKPVVTMIPNDELDPESAAGKAVAFLQDVTKLMGVEVAMEAGTDADGHVYVQMSGDSLGILIGRRGETLDALQYLTSLQVNRGQDDYTRVTLDSENYRAKREDTLIRLANRMANRAVRTGRRVNLEPMNPYERRIIHSALQPNEAVDTHSEGDEPNRHVVITLRK